MNQKEIDAIELLTAQHREMEELLHRVADSDDEATRKALYVRVADLLTVHIKSEEEIFYPAAHQARTEDDLLESLEEHLSLKRLLADLQDMAPSEKPFEAKFKVLKEQAEHHHREEETHLFPAVLTVLDFPQRATLAAQMLARQAELARRGEPRQSMTEETAAAAPLK